jgi:hypothetical protein
LSTILGFRFFHLPASERKKVASGEKTRECRLMFFLFDKNEKAEGKRIERKKAGTISQNRKTRWPGRPLAPLTLEPGLGWRSALSVG